MAERGWVVQSLDLLAGQAPWHHQRLVAALAPWGLAVTLGDREERLGFDGGTHRLLGADEVAAIELVASREAVLDLVDGRLGLATALRSGRVQARAPVTGLDDLDTAWLAYLHGAVRSSGFPRLLSRLRASGTPEVPRQ